MKSFGFWTVLQFTATTALLIHNLNIGPAAAREIPIKATSTEEFSVRESVPAKEAAAGKAAAQIEAQDARLATAPQVVLIEPFDNWTIGGGNLYTSQMPSVDIPSPWRFKRRPLSGTVPRVLDSTSTFSLAPWTVMRADDYGVYSVNMSTNPVQLEFRSVSPPYAKVALASVIASSNLALASDEAYFYIGEPANVRRGERDSYGTMTLSTLTGVNSLYVDDTFLWMLNGDGVYRQGKSCATAACPVGYQLESWADAPNGKHLRYINGTTYFWRHVSTGWNLYKLIGINKGYSPLYVDPTGTLDVGPVVANDTHLFWVEQISGSAMRMRRMPIAGGTAETIADAATLGSVDLTQLYNDSQGVIYYNQIGIYRMPYSADAITWDLEFTNLQVVQTIQNWDTAGGDVPMVGDKPTYVRAIGKLVSGPNAVDVEAALHGTTAGGTPLPGSPLRPSPFKFLPTLISGVTHEENVTNQYWLFELPGSWDNPGAIRLQVEIDPRHVFDEAIHTNNTSAWRDISFRNAPPLCAVFIPVRTHNPLPSVSDPWVSNAVSLWGRLWPGPGVWTYHQSMPIEELELCWWGPFPYPCYGPYELNQGSTWDNWIPDADKVIMSLFDRWVISDDPDECDDRGAPVHYVGMVNGKASAPGNGYGSMLGNFFWTRMPNPDPIPDYYNWNWPWSGTTMAHEAGHNWYRYHTKCSGDEKDVDPFYTHPDCWLDGYWAIDSRAHWGFDTVSKAFMNPEKTADIMSYGSKRWMSDYTYTAIMDRIGSGNAAVASATPRNPGAPNLAQAAFAARVDGVLNLTTGEGRLNWGWVTPTRGLSPGVLKKWQSLAAPAYSEWTAAAPSGTTLVPTYHIRLLDVKGAQISDNAFVPVPPISEQNSTSVGDRYAPFGVTFAHPVSPAVARVQLMRDTVVLDTLSPSTQAPSLTLQQPSGLELFSTSMTIRWEAQDTAQDRLRFNVQYSPNNGITWQALVTGMPAPKGQTSHTLTLNDLTALPGTGTLNNGLIRVAASDGYNTTIVTSPGFRLANQPPLPMITAPGVEQVFQPGEPIELQGSAIDAEDGNLGDSALSWQISPGGGLGTGARKVLEGYRPGTYTFTLTARDSSATQRSTTVSADIANIQAPKVAVPIFDGRCDDDAYAASPRLRLPFHSAGQGIVRLARTNTHLWVCFSGLDNIVGYAGEVGLMVDPNLSGGTAPLSSDFAFFVNQDGTPYTRQGNGSTFSVAGPGGLQARVTGNQNVWNAEMRIEKAMISNWDHLAGMAFQFSTAVAGSLSPISYYWPWLATKNNPSTYATVALGLVPQIDTLSTTSTPAGSAQFYLIVEGKDFTSSAQVLWNGQLLNTLAVPPAMAVALVPADKLVTPGYVSITLRNGSNDFLSNRLLFEVQNPAPTMSGINPTLVRAGSPTFYLTVSGSNFVTGTVARWNGDPQPTEVQSATQLRVQIDATDIAGPKTAGVTVYTPGPGGGTSEPMTIGVLFGNGLYLPLVRR